MKKAITLFLLLFVAAIAYPQGWQNVGTPGFSSGSTLYTTIKLDPAGTPYVAYIDWDYNGRATVKKFNGTEWENVGTPGFSGSAAHYLSLALDATGTPYVVFQDLTSDFRATVMKFNGTEWENVGLPGFSEDYVFFNAIAIDPTSGNPYVLYRDNSIGEKATVMKFDGEVWQNVGTPGFSAGTITTTSIVIDASGTPYVSFMDAGNESYTKVMKYNGDSWETVGETGIIADNSYAPSLALDSAGTPHVAYQNWFFGDGRANLKKFNGTEWEFVGEANFTIGEAQKLSLAFDSSDIPYVAFREWATDSDRVSVKKFNGTGWVNVGTPGISAGDVDFVSLAIDPSGIPYVAYEDIANGEKTTVMNFMTPKTQLDHAYCGVTLSQLSDNLLAIPVTSAQKYRFRVTDGTTTNTVIRTDTIFRINMLPSFAYNTTYTIDVSVFIDGAWSDFGTACMVTTPDVPITQLRAQDCGSMIPGFGTNLYATSVTFADGYRFRITNGAEVQTIDRTTTYFRLNQLASYEYGTIYTVEVAVSINGVFGDYGPACTVTSPETPMTMLNAASCGTTVERFSNNLYATAVPLAEGYRFRVTNGATVQTIDGTASYFRLSQLASYQYSTNYTIEVAVKIDGTYGSYGDACTVSTPAPLTQLRAQDCGTTVARFGTNLYAEDVILAQGYRFRVTNGAVVNVIDRPNRNFRISMLPSYTYNTTYIVEVAVLVDGVWGDYGTACEVSTPASGMRQNMANDEEAVREVTAFPNPFETSFTLALETESDEVVTIQAYDISGKMLDNRSVSPEELADLKIGENYAAGIYSVIVIQGSYTKVVKMVKK